ncbi:MAG: carbohydrate binding domain-containing protein [Phycisphaerales bacterium JB059]
MNRTERGGVYIAVLGVTLFVTLVGLSAMYLVNTERETRIAVSEARSARIDARSAIEIALSRVAADRSWRSNHPAGQWSDAEALGETNWGYVLDYDDSLPDDDDVEISVTVGASRKDEARFFSVDAIVSPPSDDAGANLCPNGDFDDSASPWYPVACSLSLDTDDPHAGSSSLEVSGRVLPLAGPAVDVQSFVSDGTTYEVSLWVRTANASGEKVEVGMLSMVGFDTTETKFVVTDVGDTWTRVQGELTPDWEDGESPDTVTLRVLTVGTTTNFWIDDVELREKGASSSTLPIQIVSGSFRQRVAE